MQFKIVIISLLFVSMAHFAQSQSFGQEINKKGTVSLEKLPKKMKGKESLSIKVNGTITEVCQAKGCWMTMDLGDGELMRIKFKDYGFFVPKDAAGKSATIQGVAQKEIVDVADLKHLAEDAGKSEDEIAAITQASEELTFVADGVIIH